MVCFFVSSNCFLFYLSVPSRAMRHVSRHAPLSYAMRRAVPHTICHSFAPCDIVSRHVPCVVPRVVRHYLAPRINPLCHAPPLMSSAIVTSLRLAIFSNTHNYLCTGGCYGMLRHLILLFTQALCAYIFIHTYVYAYYTFHIFFF